MPRILVTGAAGQLGTVLVTKLRERYGDDNVVATDLKPSEDGSFPLLSLNVLEYDDIKAIIQKHQINEIYHLAAILSAKGEKNPRFTWKVNLDGFINILEAAKECGVKKIFNPSSIAVFGPLTQKENTPQYPIMIPETIYGMSKEAGEQWSNYYHKNFGLDIRSLRYPGLIGYDSLPGGGTTDYAVEIFHAAIKEKQYTCFLNPDTILPMMYMPDAIRATLELMEAPAENIRVRTSYNIAAMSFSPWEIYQEIKKYIPEFTINYKPDFREKIARSWVESIDDTSARNDWNWKEEYNLSKMVEEMIFHLSPSAKLR